MIWAIGWLVLMVAFLAAEAATVTLVSLWFAAGALVALVAALLGGPLWLQVTLFLAVSAVLLALLRPLVKRYISPEITATNVDSVIGATGIVVTPVNNIAALGQVQINGVEWSARSTDGSHIGAGTLVKVDKIEGVKVFVSLAQETPVA